jgi:hypothetical protein
MALCAVGLAWCARNYRRAAEQHRLVMSIDRSIDWGYEWCRGPEFRPSWVPDWLMDALGDDFLGNVIAINVNSGYADPELLTDEGFARLLDLFDQLPKLEVIGFDDGSTTPAQLERLQQRLPHIRLIDGGFHKTIPY